MMSWPYAAVVAVRNRAFDAGLLKATSVDVPVISVGNMTAGGTGKTPLVEYIVRYCVARGKRTAVVSRGYHRSSRGVIVVSDGRSLLVDAGQGGDEPVQIARKFPPIIVVVGERRVDAAREAADRYGAEVIIADDAFQHRYLRRDLDLVVVDSRGLGTQDLLLPAGRLREPWAGLRRAHVVALSKVEMTPGSRFPEASALQLWYKGPLVRYRYRLDCVCGAPDGQRAQLEEVRVKPALAVAGIGDPDGFIQSLSTAGFAVKGSVIFPDHHLFTLSDARRIIRAMEHCGAEICVTTEKDIVRMISDDRLVHEFLGSQKVFYTCISVDIVEGEDVLRSMIDSCLGKKGIA